MLEADEELINEQIADTLKAGSATAGGMSQHFVEESLEQVLNE